MKTCLTVYLKLKSIFLFFFLSDKNGNEKKNKKISSRCTYTFSLEEKKMKYSCINKNSFFLVYASTTVFDQTFTNSKSQEKETEL